MRSSFVVRTGLPLTKQPSLREQARRRRMLAIGVMLALAAGSATVGALTADRERDGTESRTGPFSYFPSE